MSKRSRIYRLSARVGIRPNADESETIHPAHKAAWRAVHSLPARIYAARDVSAVVNARWAKAQNYALAVYKDESEPPGLDPLVEIRVRSNSRSSPLRFGNTFARWYVGDAFVAMNLAAPGCCSIFVDRGNDGFPPPAHLYGDAFDFAWIDSIREGWPSIQEIALETVWDWVARIRQTGNSVAQTRLEQVLFCLLHVGLAFGSGPDTLMWLAHAIEAIYGGPSPPLSVLRERIATLLDVSEIHQRSLTRCLRHFYDIRNSYAHGGLPIVHPFYDDALDARIDTEMDKVLDAEETGLRVLIATLQKFVLSGWRGVEFKQSVLAWSYRAKEKREILRTNPPLELIPIYGSLQNFL
jgi:hypothetical protein